MTAIRPATTVDLPSITAIYNHAVLHGIGTFHIEPRSEAQQVAWFTAHDGRHPVLVAQEEGTVVGWGSISTWVDRCASQCTGEVSVYVAETARGRGVGTALLGVLLARARELGYRSLIAYVAGPNVASLRLHEAVGFLRAGHLRRVAEKFGNELDLHILQALL